MAAVLGGPARSEGIEDLIEFGVIPPTRLESPSDNNGDREALTIEDEPGQVAEQEAVVQPPPELRLRADRQTYDARRQLFVAEGNVRAVINGGVLQADRLEFDTSFNSLFARGSVRYRKGSQYFQAGSLRFSLIQGSGSMEDVYGVLDLDTAAVDFNPLSSNQISPAPYATPSRQVPTEDPSQDRLLPVVESTGLGFPTAIDIELEAFTANRISPQGDGSGFWDQEQPLLAMLGLFRTPTRQRAMPVKAWLVRQQSHPFPTGIRTPGPSPPGADR